MSDTLADRLAAFALGTRFRGPARRRSWSRPAAGWWTPWACAVGALDEPASSIARRVAGRFQGTPSVR